MYATGSPAARRSTSGVEGVGVVERRLWMGEQPGPVAAGDVRQEHLGVEARGSGRAGLAQRVA